MVSVFILFSQPPACLHQSMQTRKPFYISSRLNMTIGRKLMKKTWIRGKEALKTFLITTKGDNFVD